MAFNLRTPTYAGICVALLATTLAPRGMCQELWGLRPGDMFRIETIIAQETSLSFDGAEPTVQRWTERLETSYRKLPSASSDLFEVRILQAGRNRESDGGTARLDLALSQPVIRVEIDKSGQAKLSGELSSLFSNGDEDQSRSLLQSMATPKVVASWVAAPFWMAPPEEPAVDLAWRRNHVMSLGPIGTMTTNVTCQIRDFIDSEATVELSGEGTFEDAPLDSTISEQLVFEEVSAKLTQFDGQGTFVVPVDQPENSRIRLPWFKEQKLHWKIEGSAVIRAGNRTVSVRFTHDQQQTSKIQPTTSFRRQNFLRRAPVIPLPQ